LEIKSHFFVSLWWACCSTVGKYAVRSLRILRPIYRRQFI